jgi:hypothetical protein
MRPVDIVRQRLHNQHIAEPMFEHPKDVVEWLGAVQAQDYAAALWAVGLRLRDVRSDDLEQAFADGTILRTHVMRPTWHFVSPADIGWLLALTAPRVNAANASRYRQLELDEIIFGRSQEALAKALQGGKQLTRPELVPVLKQAGIATDDAQRVTHLMMRAELDGIVCSGGRRSKQFTYALLKERAPHAKTLDRDEALAELVRRYFTSHGPATVHDFVWWSGLTAADARVGLHMVGSYLQHEVVDGQTYWFSALPSPAKDRSQKTCLLPNYDEYLVGYTDRSIVFDASHTQKLDSRGNILFHHTMVLDGRVVGTWKRTLTKERVILTPSLFFSLGRAETGAFALSANRYGAFLDRSATLTFQAEHGYPPSP